MTAMRIAFIGSEQYAVVPRALVAAGHEIVSVSTNSLTGLPTPLTWKAFHRETGVAPVIGPVTRERLEAIQASGPGLILCLGYPRRIPVRPGDPVPAVNIHPSPLPEGRGPAPIEWAILSGRTATAVTLHEMVERFDAGPILLHRPVAISETETSASLASRCRLVACELAVELANRFPELWAARSAQGPATYCRVPSRKDRTIDLRRPVEEAGRVLRAFEPGRIIIRVRGTDWVVFDAVSWPEAHPFAPGTLVSKKAGARLLAAQGGYVLVRSGLPERLARFRLAAGRLKQLIR